MACSGTALDFLDLNNNLMVRFQFTFCTAALDPGHSSDTFTIIIIIIIIISSFYSSVRARVNVRHLVLFAAKAFTSVQLFFSGFN
jgi:hypothetical protein